MQKLFLVLVTFSIFTGCNLLSPPPPPVPVEAYPETVGKFKRIESTDLKHTAVPYIIHSTYENTETKEQTPIKTRLEMTSSSSRAIGKLEDETWCSPKYQQSMNKDKPLFESLKEGKLTDKSGKTVGAIKVCRNVPVFDKKGTDFGTSDYYIAMTNNNLVLTVEGSNSSAKNIQYVDIDLAQLIEFAKNIPYNSNIDFPPLNLEALNSSIKQYISSKDVNNFTAPVQITSPYITGKAIAVRNFPKVEFVDFKELGLDESLQAETIADAETIIKIGCVDTGIRDNVTVSKRTDRITGKTTERRFNYPVQTSSCEKITIIDKTIPAIIAEDTVSKNILAINEYLKKLPRK